MIKICILLVLFCLVSQYQQRNPNIIRSVDQALHNFRHHRLMQLKLKMRFNRKLNLSQNTGDKTKSAQKKVEQNIPQEQKTPMSSVAIQVQLRELSVLRDNLFEYQAKVISSYDRYRTNIETLQESEDKQHIDLIDKAIHQIYRLQLHNTQLHTDLMNLDAQIELIGFVNFSLLSNPSQNQRVLIEGHKVLLQEVLKKLDQCVQFDKLLVQEQKSLWELKNKRIEVEKHEVSLALINYNEEQERKFWEKYDKLMNKNNTQLQQNSQNYKRPIDMDLENAQRTYDTYFRNFFTSSNTVQAEVSRWGVPQPGVIAQASKEAQDQYLKQVLSKAEGDEEEQQENLVASDDSQANSPNQQDQDHGSQDNQDDQHSISPIFPPVSSLNMSENQFFNDSSDKETKISQSNKNLDEDDEDEFTDSYQSDDEDFYMKPDNNRHIDFDHEDESEHSVDSSNEHEDNFKPANKNRRIDFDHEDESEHSVDSSNEHEDNFKTEITNHGINTLPIDSISKVPEENVLHGIDQVHDTNLQHNDISLLTEELKHDLVDDDELKEFEEQKKRKITQIRKIQDRLFGKNYKDELDEDEDHPYFTKAHKRRQRIAQKTFDKIVQNIVDSQYSKDEKPKRKISKEILRYLNKIEASRRSIKKLFKHD